MTNAQDGYESGITPTPGPTPTGPSPVRPAPGSAAAAEQGCRCSVLANATYRAGVTGVEPLIDPTCTVHLGVPAATAGAFAATAVASVPVVAPDSAAVTAPIPAIRSTTPWAQSAAA